MPLPPAEDTLFAMLDEQRKQTERLDALVSRVGCLVAIVCAVVLAQVAVAVLLFLMRV